MPPHKIWPPRSRDFECLGLLRQWRCRGGNELYQGIAEGRHRERDGKHEGGPPDPDMLSITRPRVAGGFIE